MQNKRAWNCCELFQMAHREKLKAQKQVKCLTFNYTSKKQNTQSYQR